MAAGSGRSFILKIGDGGSPEAFTTIVAFRSNSLRINGQLVDTTTKDSTGWRELLSGGGIRSMSMSGSGVFKDAANEESLRSVAFSQALRSFQMLSGAHVFQGSFQVLNYERTGEVDGAEEFSCTFESSGVVSYTP